MPGTSPLPTQAKRRSWQGQSRGERAYLSTFYPPNAAKTTFGAFPGSLGWSLAFNPEFGASVFPDFDYIAAWVFLNWVCLQPCWMGLKQRVTSTRRQFSF